MACSVRAIVSMTGELCELQRIARGVCGNETNETKGLFDYGSSSTGITYCDATILSLKYNNNGEDEAFHFVARRLLRSAITFWESFL